MPPTKTATFSVFDGIKWQTVISTTPIGENWTHVAATFNGTSISIYVNGRLQSTLQLKGIPTISVNGKLATKTVNQISSDSDIVIGAYLNTLRGKASNEFSGSIENVNLYDSVLDQSQIANLYDNNILSGKVDATITSLPAVTNSTTNGNLTISDNVSAVKMSVNHTNNSGLFDQIRILDAVVINSTTNANYATPAYFIPLESPLNSTIYDNSTIQTNVTSLKIPINNTSLLNGTSLLNSTIR